jgi:hypothetical protein
MDGRGEKVALGSECLEEMIQKLSLAGLPKHSVVDLQRMGLSECSVQEFTTAFTQTQQNVT